MRRDKIEEDIFGFKPKSKINAKVKGNKNENECAKSLALWLMTEIVRVPQSGGLRWKNSQGIAADLMVTDRDFEFPFSLETKHLGKMTKTLMRKAWTQAMNDALRCDKIPMAMLKRNRLTKFVHESNQFYRFADYYVFLDRDFGGAIMNIKVRTHHTMEYLSRVDRSVLGEVYIFKFSEILAGMNYQQFIKAVKRTNLVGKFKEKHGISKTGE